MWSKAPAVQEKPHKGKAASKAEAVPAVDADAALRSAQQVGAAIPNPGAVSEHLFAMWQYLVCYAYCCGVVCHAVCCDALCDALDSIVFCAVQWEPVFYLLHHNVMQMSSNSSCALDRLYNDICSCLMCMASVLALASQVTHKYILQRCPLHSSSSLATFCFWIDFPNPFRPLL